jgi:hypothetical protein
MRELNSAQIGITAGSICRLPRPVPFPEGRGCARLRAEITVGAKQTNAVAKDLTGAAVKAIVAVLCDTSTLRFGDRKPEIVDSSLPYARAREQFIALTMDDFMVSLSTYNGGVAKRIRDIADADVWSAAMAQNAVATLVIEFNRAFEVVRLGPDAYSYCPGSTQMKQIQWEIVRGGGTFGTADFAQNAAADVLFLADDIEAHDDQWAFVPRIYQQEEAGRESHGPRGPIGLLACWEYTSAGAATALTIFAIKRNGDTPLHDNVQAKRVVRDAAYTDPIGAYDLNLLATVVHNIPGDAEKHDIPVGEAFLLSQTGSELSPPKSAWLHIPVYAQEQIDALVGENVQTPEGVKLINAAAKSGKALGSGAAALEPVLIARKGSADFESLPGRVHAISLAATTHVPEAIMAAAQHAVAAANGLEAKAAAAEKGSKVIAKALPGTLSGRRGVPSQYGRALGVRLGGR